jgi:Kef-type K+ transport system membrane component KefB
MTAHTTAVLVLDLVVIAGAARILGLLARLLGQPAVVGEILGGILLGPTLFGGAVTRALFPAEVQPSLTILANVGVAVFMFLVGLELNRNLLRGQGRIASGVALCAIVLPFALGAVLALYLLRHHPSTQRPAYILFLGTAMAITAFPVLARILTDRGLLATPIGALALACASIDDVLAWSLLAVVTALAGATAASWRVLLVIPYAAVLLLMVRPLLVRLAVRAETARWTPRPVSGRVGAAAVLFTVAAGLWLSAKTTEWMGLHLIFGAFLFGVVMPRDQGARLRTWTVSWLGRICSILLLPIFFMVAGTSVDLSKIDGTALRELGLILLVSIGGKGIGAFAGARLTGLRTRHSAVIAILLNTRGLTELIVLTVGLQLHVIDTRVYSLLVVMALVTTAMTGVLLSVVYPEWRSHADMTPQTNMSESKELL